ncbi:hypothetical protein CIPAW_13G148200 [Carya illinoinensis]|uniref:Uncharacterized protein n=1 Tax=Carya illinoinensis TaxID=32201 RepID=A0A8T1NU74_CARIL|nr:hypothetical protein CIPAW_13G148200 [Carya illinoinensis]
MVSLVNHFDVLACCDGSSHVKWKEKKKMEKQEGFLNWCLLLKRPSKKQRLPLSVAQPMMKKQKEREQTMLKKRLILGQFGGKHGYSAKRSFWRRKPEDRVLKASKGHFRNGILDVKHLLRSTTSSRNNDSSIHVDTKGKKKGDGKKNRGTKGGGRKRR